MEYSLEIYTDIVNNFIIVIKDSEGNIGIESHIVILQNFLGKKNSALEPYLDLLYKAFNTYYKNLIPNVLSNKSLVHSASNLSLSELETQLQLWIE